MNNAGMGHTKGKSCCPITQEILDSRPNAMPLDSPEGAGAGMGSGSRPASPQRRLRRAAHSESINCAPEDTLHLSRAHSLGRAPPEGEPVRARPSGERFGARAWCPGRRLSATTLRGVHQQKLLREHGWDPVTAAEAGSKKARRPRGGAWRRVCMWRTERSPREVARCGRCISTLAAVPSPSELSLQIPAEPALQHP